MKSLLKSTYSKTKLLIVLFAFSCGGLMMAQAEDTHSLFMGLVYSATDEVSDGDLPFNPHSSYLIYTPDGKLFKSVENHMSRSDEIPDIVRLPAGSYIVEARSANNGYVRVRVVIKPRRQTVLDLDSTVKESPSGIASN
jgi:hypothetical protein